MPTVCSYTYPVKVRLLESVIDALLQDAHAPYTADLVFLASGFVNLLGKGNSAGLKKLADRLKSRFFILYIFYCELMYDLPNRITSIRNGEQASRRSIVCPIPKGAQFKKFIAVLSLLRKEGAIRGFTFNAVSTTKGKNGGQPTLLVIYLKYDSAGKSALRSIFSVSTPGRRAYVSSTSLWQPQSTSGFRVLSTAYGLLTDAEARRYRVGGELLFGVT